MRDYVTVSGDTWDLIAFRLFADGGRERNMTALIQANASHAMTVIFPAGVTLSVPDEAYVSDKIIPPWRR